MEREVLSHAGSQANRGKNIHSKFTHLDRWALCGRFELGAASGQGRLALCELGFSAPLRVFIALDKEVINVWATKVFARITMGNRNRFVGGLYIFLRLDVFIHIANRV